MSSCRMIRCLPLQLAASAAMIGASPLFAEEVSPSFQKPAAVAHVRQAFAIAGSDFAGDAQRLCRPARRQVMVGSPPPAGQVVMPPRARPERMAFTPNRVADNMWYFGTSEVGSTVISTSRGLVLIDAMTTSADAERVLLAGMKREGLDPSNIRYIIVTHAHGDHHGGVELLRSRYPGFRVVMSADDWNFVKLPFYMPDGNLDSAPKPPHHPSDISWRDKFALKVGDTVFHLVETPGHTPGTTGLVYNVRSRGKREVVAQWGGGSPMDSLFSSASVERFARLADRQGATIEWSSHTGMGFWGSSDGRSFAEKAASLANGATRNPFVAGRGNVDRYLRILVECKRATEAELQ